MVTRDTRGGCATSVQPPPAAPGRDRRREQRGWYVYDFAITAFSASVLTVFLGPYLTHITKAAADAHGHVHPLGIPVRAGAYFPYGSYGVTR